MTLVPPGSSPLARGLLAVIESEFEAAWIIPARAGFTPSGPPARAQAWDHPRSRGVYTLVRAETGAEFGSSPLARGLRVLGELDVDRLRIIPARAGFTRSSAGARRRPQDHPRSRGVYSQSRHPRLRRRGSSPLARGLRWEWFSRTWARRIIPARAGFTWAGPLSGGGVGDHPRSRGVYTGRIYQVVAPAGSSPLARGLRTVTIPPSLVPGIIPARAGFTSWPRRGSTPTADHPRSRGVYPISTSTPTSPSGSSPLARGLLLQGGDQAAQVGIIPARAGFTPPGGTRLRARPDHPRSRGVYHANAVGEVPADGSSPLARGLLVAQIVVRAADGIIPARAGFTVGIQLADRLARDHPRSRGVYPICVASKACACGSSPLARGLHEDGRYRDAIPGIIPARAGFTSPMARGPTTATDHPRSRGVYPVNADNVLGFGGSSPLARGLRAPAPRYHCGVGIIPARAGFTARPLERRP